MLAEHLDARNDFTLFLITLIDLHKKDTNYKNKYAVRTYFVLASGQRAEF